MLKTLIWIVSNDGRFFQGALKILERQHNGIDLVGVTAGAPINIVNNGQKVPFMPLTEVDRGRVYDVLLVVGAKQIGMSRITQAARQLKLPEEKLLGDWIVCIPGFTLDKYRRLQRSRLSIFSVNCFGAFISHTLGLPFRSPFVNLFLPQADFIKFLRAPRVYLEEHLTYKGKNQNSAKTYEFPVANLGNISVNMMHYKTFEESVDAWEKRKSRINWYNLFVEMFTEDPEILQQFDAMPYGKKVCFVPFKSNLDSAFYVNPEIDKNWSRFVDKINEFGKAKIPYYDPFDMLLYGKKTPLIEM